MHIMKKQRNTFASHVGKRNGFTHEILVFSSSTSGVLGSQWNPCDSYSSFISRSVSSTCRDCPSHSASQSGRISLSCDHRSITNWQRALFNSAISLLVSILPKRSCCTGSKPCWSLRLPSSLPRSLLLWETSTYSLPSSGKGLEP